MAEEIIKLSKKVISNKKSNEDYNKSFEEISKTPHPVSEEDFLLTYQDLFYDIPKKGKKSHEYLVTEGNDYLHPEIETNLDNHYLLLLNIHGI